MLDKRVGVFTHTQYRDGIFPVHGPSDSIKDYLIKQNCGEVFYFQHSLYRGGISSVTTYNNKKIKNLCTYKFHKNLNEVFRYLVDGILTTLFFLKKPKLCLVIAADPLNFIYAFILKKLGRVENIIFYTLDFAYQRFSNPVLNYIYHQLDRFAVINCDQAWSACQKICDVRENQGLENSKNKYLPNSPIIHGISQKNWSEIEKHTLVMVFSDYKQIDIDIMLKSLEKLIPLYPKIKLKFIGRGDFKPEIEKCIRNSEIKKHVEMLDISNHQETLSEISYCGIGLECNNQKLTWNAFREPIKIKEYMAFGLPIISKKGHALIDEIQTENIGFIVNEVPEFVAAVRRYFDNEAFYLKTRENILKHSMRYDKEMVLNNLLFSDKIVSNSGVLNENFISSV